MKHLNVKSLASLLLIIIAGIVSYSLMDALSATNVMPVALLRNSL
jgi:hypothetical protein